MKTYFVATTPTNGYVGRYGFEEIRSLVASGKIKIDYFVSVASERSYNDVVKDDTAQWLPVTDLLKLGPASEQFVAIEDVTRKPAIYPSPNPRDIRSTWNWKLAFVVFLWCLFVSYMFPLVRGNPMVYNSRTGESFYAPPQFSGEGQFLFLFNIDEYLERTYFKISDFYVGFSSFDLPVAGAMAVICAFLLRRCSPRTAITILVGAATLGCLARMTLFSDVLGHLIRDSVSLPTRELVVCAGPVVLLFIAPLVIEQGRKN